MLFDVKNFDHCVKIIGNELTKKNIIVGDNVLKKIAGDIINISYSKGGDYSDEIIQSYAETYIEEGFYKKYLS